MATLYTAQLDSTFPRTAQINNYTLFYFGTGILKRPGRHALCGSRKVAATNLRVKSRSFQETSAHNT
jgi:hypothetical protein